MDGKAIFWMPENGHFREIVTFIQYRVLAKKKVDFYRFCRMTFRSTFSIEIDLVEGGLAVLCSWSPLGTCQHPDIHRRTDNCWFFSTCWCGKTVQDISIIFFVLKAIQLNMFHTNFCSSTLNFKWFFWAPQKRHFSQFITFIYTDAGKFNNI